MNATPFNTVPTIDIQEDLQQCFQMQRAAYLAHPEPSLQERRQDLKQLAKLLKDNREALVAAINADYGNRSEFETLFGEYLVALQTIDDAVKHLKRWMRVQRRHIDFMMFPGASNRLVPQPLGVVGVIVPWNFPINLTFCPLASIFAAGNRAMVKMSENSKHLVSLLIQLSPQYFPEDKLKFFADSDGMGQVRGPAFSSIAFDHLLFTGSGATGRSVMSNAARNLTPVTLELGGKSPAIIGEDYNLDTAAQRVIWVKMFNAGQICTNIDYVLIPAGSEQRFVDACKAAAVKRYPDINSPDYTSIIDARSFARLQSTLDDAVAKGATVINLLDGQVPSAQQRKFPPHIVLNPSEDMVLSQREIFGPILPVRTYHTKQEVAQYINSHDRPLAIYIYSKDASLQQYYISNVMSGGVGINEALLHVAQHDLPFGGVGPSGMGHYHGQEGFNTFSKLRPIFYQGPFSAIQMMFQPPYNKGPRKLLELIIKLKT